MNRRDVAQWVIKMDDGHSGTQKLLISVLTGARERAKLFCGQSSVKITLGTNHKPDKDENTS
jgi:hypothetical protein